MMGNHNSLYDVVCGMSITDIYSSQVSDFNGNKYYFCCEDCKNKFESNPLQYINNVIKEDENQTIGKKAKWERDHICGDMIKISDAKAMSLYKGTTYYFCCNIYKREFDKNPSGYADREEGYYGPQNPSDFIDGRFRIL